MRDYDCDDRREARKEESIPLILTPAEAMDILGIGKNTMYRLLSSGELKGIRVGRSWRIALSALQAFLT